MRRLGVIVVLLAVLLTAGTAVAAKIITVGQRANGKTVTLKKGYMLRVKLPWNPSTGYSWYITRLNRRVLEPGNSRYVPRRPIRVGSGGTLVREFYARRIGRTTLRMIYARRSNRTRPARRFTVTVRVTSAL